MWEMLHLAVEVLYLLESVYVLSCPLYLWTLLEGFLGLEKNMLMNQMGKYLKSVENNPGLLTKMYCKKKLVGLQQCLGMLIESQ